MASASAIAPPSEWPTTQRPLQAQLVAQRGKRVGLRRQVGGAARRARGVAGAGAVDGDDAEVLGKRRDHAVAEILKLARQAMHQQQRRALPVLHHMQSRARHLDKAPARRHGRFDAPGGTPGVQP
jgi:hypothetical protein